MQGQLVRRNFRFAVAAMTAAVVFLGMFPVSAQRPDRVLEPVRGQSYVGDLPWRVLNPVSFENLLVFPVVARSGYDTGAFVTLDEALASGDVVIAESGSEIVRNSRGSRELPRGAQVNQLVLINRGKRPLLLLAGEVVTGGKQDRVIGKDRIIAPGSEPLPLDVFCVERGRWSGTKAEFSASQYMAHPSVREKAAVDKAQDQVWAAVREGTTAKSPPSTANGAPAARVADPRIARDELSSVVAESRSEAYGRIYSSKKIAASVETFTDEINRRFRAATAGLRGEQVVGVVIAYGSEVTWSEVFASNSLFDRYWPKLLRSYVVEAMARPQWHGAATVAEARAFLAPMGGRETIESEPGVYRWREISAGRLAQIELDSLIGRTFTLHRVKIHRTA